MILILIFGIVLFISLINEIIIYISRVDKLHVHWFYQNKKLIIITVFAVTLLCACSDRDENTNKEVILSVKKNNQEKFKLNKSGVQIREGEPQATTDTIKVLGLSSHAAKVINIVIYFENYILGILKLYLLLL